MKSKVTTISNSLFSFNEETPLAFNAVSGLCVLFSVFSLFTLFSLMIPIFFGLEINMMPVAVALMITAALGITVFILSYAIEMTTKLTIDGE